MNTDSHIQDKKQKTGREKNGTYKKGFVSNPAGRPASGYQSFKDRLAFWMETKTVSEIEALIKNKKQWGKLPAIDAMVAMRVSESYEYGGGASMTIILDRLLGKPNQSLTGLDEKPLIPQTDINEIARRTAFLLATAGLSEQSAPLPITLDGAKVPDHQD